jgi:hypothetical protein
LIATFDFKCFENGVQGDAASPKRNTFVSGAMLELAVL